MQMKSSDFGHYPPDVKPDPPPAPPRLRFNLLRRNKVIGMISSNAPMTVTSFDSNGEIVWSKIYRRNRTEFWLILLVLSIISFFTGAAVGSMLGWR